MKRGQARQQPQSHAIEVLPPLHGGRTPDSPVSHEQRSNLWQPGQSGNPDGMSKTERQIRMMIRERTVPITNKMMQTFFDTKDERVITVLGKELLYRAYGKPREAPDDDTRARPDISKLTEKDRNTLKRLLQKTVANGEVEPDGE